MSRPIRVHTVVQEARLGAREAVKGTYGLTLINPAHIRWVGPSANNLGMTAIVVTGNDFAIEVIESVENVYDQWLKYN